MTDVAIQIRGNANTGAVVAPTVSQGSTGHVAWDATGPASLPDALSSLAVVASGASSEYMSFSGFDFDIPLNTTVLGVEAIIERSGMAGIEDSGVFLLVDGARAGTDLGVAAWPTSRETTTFGGTTNVWGNPLTPSDVNKSNFGFSIGAANNTVSGDAISYIDYAQVRVSYSIPVARAGIVTGALPTGNYERLNISPDTQSTASGYVIKYDTRFDDPRYYTGDTTA